MTLKKRNITGADPGFFLGGGALVSWSTSAPVISYGLKVVKM